MPSLARLPTQYKLGGIRGPKVAQRPLHSFHDEEEEVLENWSSLSDLYAAWDLDKNGVLERDEVLFGIKAFCRNNKVVYSDSIVQHLMDVVNRNCNDFDTDRLVDFLVAFAKSANIAPFDVVFFLQDFFEYQEEKLVEGEHTVLVPAIKRDASCFERTVHQMLYSLDEEVVSAEYC